MLQMHAALQNISVVIEADVTWYSALKVFKLVEFGSLNFEMFSTLEWQCKIKFLVLWQKGKIPLFTMYPIVGTMK